MRKTFRNIIFSLLFIVVAIWLLQKIKIIPSLHDVFSSKPVVIDQTPILIKEIKSIAQLITVTAYDEVVVDSTIITTASSVIHSFNSISPLPILPSVDTRLVLIAKGKVLAGTDLKELRPGAFNIKQDTVSLTIPKALILDAIINPGDFETFDEKGKWSNEAVTTVKLRAKQKMIDRAIQRNILQKADAKAKAVMEDFLKSSGFKKVHISIQ